MVKVNIPLDKVKSKYRYTAILLRQLVITDFKVRYQGSALGYLWSLLRPSAIFLILYFVFGQVLKVGETVPNYALYLLFGIVIWNFFVELTSGSVTSIVSKGDLMRKLSFPRYVIVVSSSFAAVINLGLNLFVVGVFALVQGVQLDFKDLLIIPLLIELYLFGLSVAFLLSALFVKYRDISYIWEVLIQGAFYATPILYPISLVLNKSEALAKIIILNPVAQIAQDVRYVLVTDQTITISDIYGNQYMRFVPIALVVVCFLLFARYFRKRSIYFAEEV